MCHIRAAKFFTEIHIGIYSIEFYYTPFSALSKRKTAPDGTARFKSHKIISSGILH